MEQRFWYDYVVVNDRLSDCIDDIVNIIAKEAD
jgi:guanylate kinase